ncbi:MAG TPA: hypothetical protein VFH48_29065 [Chloroflexota bacterium]|nr:hypothetical protein [Chloroflexota bacterium]
MAVSVPDPSDATPEPWRTGRTDAPGRPTDPSLGHTAHDADDQATSRLDALRNRPSERRDASAGPHAAAEWITLAISSLIVLSLIGLITYFYLTASTAPAAVEVEPRLEETYQAGSRYYLPFTVRNTGGETGEEVRVRISVTDPSGRVEAAEVMVAFLAGGGSSKAMAAFGSDPRQGQVEAVVVSYLEP